LPTRGDGLLGDKRGGNDGDNGVSGRDEGFHRLRRGIQEGDILDEGKTALGIEQIDRAGKNDGEAYRPEMNRNQADQISD
jgi:hypothetical protein